jgi:hypothetical protein
MTTKKARIQPPRKGLSPVTQALTRLQRTRLSAKAALQVCAVRVRVRVASRRDFQPISLRHRMFPRLEEVRSTASRVSTPVRPIRSSEATSRRCKITTKKAHIQRSRKGLSPATQASTRPQRTRRSAKTARRVCAERRQVRVASRKNIQQSLKLPALPNL